MTTNEQTAPLLTIALALTALAVAVAIGLAAKAALADVAGRLVPIG